MDDVIKNEMNIISGYMFVALDELDSETDSLDPDKINSIINLIEEKRIELKNKYPTEELLKYEKKFLLLSKQIKIKIDSVIEKLEIEQLSVQNELQKFYNRKKIINYGR